jgi:antitoxin CptB
MSEPESKMSPADASARELRRRRLLFRASHRGTHENDLLIGGFVTRNIDVLGDAELAELEELMELPDVDLADWLSGRRPIPAELEGGLLRRMRDEALARAGEGR